MILIRKTRLLVAVLALFIATEGYSTTSFADPAQDAAIQACKTRCARWRSVLKS